jgi:hypothetical protein
VIVEELDSVGVVEALCGALDDPGDVNRRR